MENRQPEMRLVITEYCGIERSSLKGFGEIVYAGNPADAVQSALTEGADCVILGYMPGYEEASEAAARIAVNSGAAVLLLFFADAPATVIKQAAEAGVMVSHVNALGLMLPALRAMRTRIRCFENRTDMLRRRLDDSGIVNRAKLLLMSRLNMSESQAHRYIEKTAMDGSISRREVAENIIRIYES